ncbi:MAG: MBL fold metallo-hydrolase [Longimicrobiales bacterium]|nr:MBL fold metallo-hydrolase [Longimicrobiales bacterium]
MNATSSRSRIAESAPAGARAFDTEHNGLPGAIAAWWIDGPEPTLVDPGPAPSLPTLLEKLRAEGIDPGELRHLALTHIHLDHAGAAGELAALCPQLTVHVHLEGAPHLVDPERLVASTRRTFGEAYDDLYGEVRPIPADRIRVWRPGEGVRIPLGGVGATTLRALPTPGHIAHHLAFLDERDGTLFCGDALGIRLAPEGAIFAPTPPPAIDLDAWMRTLDDLEAVGPERIAPTHFGLHAPRIDAFRSELLRLALRVRAALEIDDAEEDALRYDAETRARLGDHLDREWVDRYFDVFSAANDYRGVVRFLTRAPDWRAPDRRDA